jgi:hypothetical protein
MFIWNHATFGLQLFSAESLSISSMTLTFSSQHTKREEREIKDRREREDERKREREIKVKRRKTDRE